MFTPTRDRALIRPEQPVEKVKGGFIIAETAKEPPERGEILAVGPDCMVTVGSRVIFKRYTADEIEEEGEKLLIVEEEDILGIV